MKLFSIMNSTLYCPFPFLQINARGAQLNLVLVNTIICNMKDNHSLQIPQVHIVALGEKKLEVSYKAIS